MLNGAVVLVTGAAAGIGRAIAELAAAEGASRMGIRVNAICPGAIETAMVDRLEAAVPQFREALLAQKPMGRMGSAAEVAPAAIWLASDLASFTTGHALTIDGFVTH